MGHRKRSAPRRGSLGVRPRKRAESIIPRVRSWPLVLEEPSYPIGFLGYKVGMSHVLMIDDRPGSPTEGKEIFSPITVLETPPMVLAGIRLYGYDPNKGKYTLTEAWASRETLEKYLIDRLVKRFALSKKNNSAPTEKQLEKLEKLLDDSVDLRLLLMSQPKLAGGIPKKTPEIIEVPLSGSTIKAKFDYASNKLGGLVRINKVFKPGFFLDVIGVTKGKGFQGPVKRFGVKELPRWHKHRKASRTVGSRGSRVGALSPTPQAGQMGFHQRVDYNKRILMIGVVEGNSDLLDIINPPSGWHKYGLVKNDFIVLSGSVPGTRKRPLILRHPVRKAPWTPQAPPKITYIHTKGEL